MLIGKKEFIAGLLMATISVSAVTKLTSLYAVENSINSEVEFSQRIGLFDSERLSESTLKSNIAEIAFYRGLNLILVDKGIVNSFNPADLEKIGITNTAAPMCSITRQKATETIFRALMYADNRGNIKIPKRSKDISFKDWTPTEKYQDTAVYAIKNYILKGVGQNVFKPSKKLTVREALILLQRVYELKIKPVSFSNDKNGSFALKDFSRKANKTKTIYIEPELEKFFKDVSPTNPMAETMKKLINAGAFDQTILNHEANLPKSIKNGDFALICKGMLNKAGKPEMGNSIDVIMTSVKADEAISRNTVAQMGAAMVNAYPHRTYNIQANYTDVEAGSGVDAALKGLAKAGIRMGYSDGSFKGNEKVSRYEAFNLLNIIVGDNVGSRIKITTINEDEIPALQPAVEKPVENKNIEKPVVKDEPVVKNEPVVKEAPKQPVMEQKVEEKKQETIANIEAKANTQASKLEQQLSQKYSGLSFQERMELRKAQFHKIFNRDDTK